MMIRYDDHSVSVSTVVDRRKGCLASVSMSINTEWHSFFVITLLIYNNLQQPPITSSSATTNWERATLREVKRKIFYNYFTKNLSLFFLLSRAHKARATIWINTFWLKYYRGLLINIQGFEYENKTTEHE